MGLEPRSAPRAPRFVAPLGSSVLPPLRGLALLLAVLVCAGFSTGSGRQLGMEPWPVDWFSDLPAVDMTGTWLFDPDTSDAMPESWQGKEVRYEINQQGAFIALDFRVPGSQSNQQTYRWDSTIARFERGGRLVEEAARWTAAGRMLEIAGRHWDPETPEDRANYRFAYTLRGDVLTFVTENAAGRTVWRFNRQRGAM